MQDRYPVGAVKTTLDIVEAVVELDGAGVSELSGHLDVPKSTVFDHLETLRNRGFVVKNDQTYKISYRFLELGERHRHSEQLVDIAEPELKKLAAETDEYASLVTEEDGEAVITDTKRGDQAVRVTVYNGIRMKMHTVAAGKAILAYLPDDRVDEILDSHGMEATTNNTITDRQTLFDDLEDVRQQGFALDNEERIEGMRSIAAPIIDRSGAVHGSITVYGPTQRIDDERFTETIPQKLLELTNVIEVTLNYE